jgi:hypothetical protein
MGAGLLGYLVIAGIGGSAGFLLGALLGLSRIGALHARLASHEQALAARQQRLADLGEAVRPLLAELDDEPAHAATIARARHLLTRD